MSFHSALQHYCYLCMNFYSDGLVKLEFWSADDNPKGTKIYEEDLIKGTLMINKLIH